MVAEEGAVVAGRYRLDERIGKGAMGVVWRASDLRLSRTVAIKKLMFPPGMSPEDADEAVARCMREGRIAARLQHPNAIAVYDVVDDDGMPCLVMEYMQSASLAVELSTRGPLDPREVAAIGSYIAAALAAAHEAGIVHRDMKPGNVLIGDDGAVKITDFGISRANDDVSVTKTGMIAGTPAYLAPEVAVGEQPSSATDIYSLGSTLYAAVEGQPPFGLSENTLGLLHRVAAGEIDPPQRAGPLTPALYAMLDPDPTRRPSAVQVQEMLGAVARGEQTTLPGVMPVPPPVRAEQTQVIAPVVERTVRPLPPPRRTHSRMPLVLAGIGLLAVLAIGGWLISAQSDRTPSSPTPPAETKQQEQLPVATSTSTTHAPTPTTERTLTTTKTTKRTESSTTTTTTSVPSTSVDTSSAPTTTTTTAALTTTTTA